MELVGMALIVVGAIVSLVGGIWFLIEAFKESPLWGIGCIVVPLVSLFFLILHWDRAGKPFLIQLAGAVPLIAGIFIAGPR